MNTSTPPLSIDKNNQGEINSFIQSDQTQQIPPIDIPLKQPISTTKQPATTILKQSSSSKRDKNVFTLLFDEPDLMEQVVSFIQLPHNYFNIHPKLSHFLLVACDKYFWVRFKIRIKDLFCENIDKKITSSQSFPITSFLDLLRSNKHLTLDRTQQYLTYLAVVGKRRQLLSLHSSSCFVTFCLEYCQIKMLEESLLSPSSHFEFLPIQNACNCDLHAAWITRVKSQLLLQRDPLPEDFLQWICHRYGYKIGAQPVEFNRLLIFFAILTGSVHLVFPDVPDYVLFLTFMRVFLDVNQELINMEMIDDMVSRLRAFYFPLHIERLYLDIQMGSSDMSCLKALSLESSIVALTYNLFFTRKFPSLPDVYVDFFCNFFDCLNQWCNCKVHSQTSGVRLIEIIFLSTSAIPIKFMRHLTRRYGSGKLCKELLVCIGLQTPTYSDEMYLLVTHCLMDKEVLKSFFNFGGEKNMRKLHKWTKMYGLRSDISEIMRIYIFELARFKKFCAIYFIVRIVTLILIDGYLTPNFPNTYNALAASTICEMIALLILFMR